MRSLNSLDETTAKRVRFVTAALWLVTTVFVAAATSPGALAQKPLVPPAPPPPPFQPLPALAERTQTERTVTVSVDKLGDGKMVIDCKYPPAAYQLEMNRCRPSREQIAGEAPPPPDIGLYLRSLAVSKMWFILDPYRGTFNDATNTIHLEVIVRGMARNERGDFWECLLVEDQDIRTETAGIYKNTATLSNVAKAGPLATTYKIETPAGSDGLKLLREPLRLAYRPPAVPAGAGVKTGVDFRFEAKPYVMTFAAKCYASPEKFPQLWAARTTLRNTGDQPLQDCRVRFRLAEYTADWGEWSRCATVLPYQTVADPYFPLLDIDKVNKLEGRRTTTLKVEYEYKQADGKVVRDDVSRRVEILGHNDLVSSCLPTEELTDFYSVWNNGPLGLACFVTKDDPVVREAAGLISGKTPGLDAKAGTDESVIAFMYATYDFLQHNKTAYQLPPGLFNGREFVQHVKYGRDVLQNRAGTCIDLAIFFGSVCEAAGMEPVLFLVKGHCFPAVRLPQSKTLFALEATRIPREDFWTAAEEGAAELNEVLTGKKPAYKVDILELRKQGVNGLELPRLPGGTVAAWKYERGRILDWQGKMIRPRAVKPGEVVTNSIGMKMTLVEAKAPFLFGSPKSEAGRNEDELQFKVIFRNPYLVGVYEVTQAEYEKVMGANPSWFSAKGGGKDAVAGMDTALFPVEQVSCEDAKKFCERLSAMPGERAARRLYRLPTEAEWEYACRGGTTSAFNVGDGLTSKDANIAGDKPYLDAPAGPNLQRTAKVGSYKPNKFGLYDMHGNVAEWCADGYFKERQFQSMRLDRIGIDSDGDKVAIDPDGDPKSETNLLRGGAYVGAITLCRSAARRDRAPTYQYRTNGFRVVCVLPEHLDR